MKKYPFKFLDAYAAADRDIFFGRDREIDELYRMVFQTNLLLVYGGSGTGKTSLIRCGLANRFKESQWLDLYIRRGSDINQSLLKRIRKASPQLAVVEKEAESPDWFEELVAEEKTNVAAEVAGMEYDHPVAEALRALYLAAFTPIYLIFDQFEELYTLGNAEEQAQFIATVAGLVRLPLPVKIIIVMREEYLARLYDLEVAVPQLRNKKLRIEAMDLPGVETIILQATVHHPNSTISLEQGQEKAIARAIIEKIREGDVNVKLPYLQVFMDRLYELATGEDLSREQAVTFNLELVQQAGYIGDVLADFIDRQSFRIHRKLSEIYGSLPNELVWQFLSPFVTIDGTKIPIKEHDTAPLQAVLPEKVPATAFIKSAIAELESTRILRYRKEERTYEVAHDALAKQIAEKRSEEEKAYLKAKRIISEGLSTFGDTHTLLSKEQLAYIQPYDDRLKTELTAAQLTFVRDSQRKRRRQVRNIRLGIIGAFAMALLVILLVLSAQQKTQQALDDLLAAQAAREKTELRVLLQNAAQIANGSNCPPETMRRTIDSLYRKQRAEESMQQQYRETMARLAHCNK